MQILVKKLEVTCFRKKRKMLALPQAQKQISSLFDFLSDLT